MGDDSAVMVTILPWVALDGVPCSLPTGSVVVVGPFLVVGAVEVAVAADVDAVLLPSWSCCGHT